MRVFVDIGSHEGQTLEEVVKPRWGFDEIHAIEPMPRELAVLELRYGGYPKVKIHPFALADKQGGRIMFGTNDLLEASLYANKNDADESVRTAVSCIAASEFFRVLPPADLFVNMNCEGSEIPILDSLIDSRQIERVTHMLISFDIHKVVGKEYEEARIRARMAEAGFDRFTSTYADEDTHQKQIAAWLEWAMWP